MCSFAEDWVHPDGCLDLPHHGSNMCGLYDNILNPLIRGYNIRGFKYVQMCQMFDPGLFLGVFLSTKPSCFPPGSDRCLAPPTFLRFSTWTPPRMASRIPRPEGRWKMPSPGAFGIRWMTYSPSSKNWRSKWKTTTQPAHTKCGCQ